MEEQKNKKVGFFLVIVAVVILVCAGVLYVTIFKDKKSNNTTKTNTNDKKNYLSYKMTGNGLQNFDLYFLQLENDKTNKIYSPLSIKYALEMLAEAANGESKEQLTSVLGEYTAKKYPNNKNMSFANAMFIKDSYKDSVKDEYTKNLEQKFNASVFYDSFKTPDKVNSFVKNKTLNLIDELVDDVSSNDFLLINALAIDMEWVNKLKMVEDDYEVYYPHENYSVYVNSFESDGYDRIEFKDIKDNVAGLDIAASANRYDIVKELGEENIRKIVTEEYEKYLNDPDSNSCGDDLPTKQAVDEYMKEIKTNYKSFSKSTDFSFYVDDDIKVFAKDLKTYDGTTLQYVSIMPNKEELDTYIKNIKAENIDNIISKIKEVKYDSFKEGVITKVEGSIPVFNFEYELKLLDDLVDLGITDVFDSNKADLSNMTSSKAYIDSAIHKANISLSNDGIKAAAATSMGGRGAGDCGFDYLFDVPVEEIDLTFDKPYMFMVRDKDTGEVWFMGTIYQPSDYYTLEDDSNYE